MTHKNLNQISRQVTILDLRVLNQNNKVTFIELSDVLAVALPCTKRPHYTAQNAHTFPCLQPNDQQRVSELNLHLVGTCTSIKKISSITLQVLNAYTIPMFKSFTGISRTAGKFTV